MFKRIGDLNVQYEVRGNGYPFVLLHGGGSRAQTFEHMVPLLAKASRVYVFDQRGLGEPGRPPEPRLTYPVWRQDLLRFLDAFGLDTVALGGWSLGGAVALDVVVTPPERVSHLILIGSSNPRLPSSDRAGFPRRRELIEKGARPEQIAAEKFGFSN